MSNSYAFDKNAKDGDTVTLENGVTYQFEEAKDRWMVLSVGEGAAGRGFKPHLFQMRGSFEITNGKVVGAPENPNGTGKKARDFYDDLEFAGYPGVYHISNWDGHSGTKDNDDDQYQPGVVEYFLINGAGAFKENKDDGTWENAGLDHVKANIAVGDIVTVKVHNITERDWDDKYSGGYSHKLEHRWRVTEVLPVVDEYDDQLGNDGDWQCLKVEKIERDELYRWHDHIYYSERNTPLVEVSVLDPSVFDAPDPEPEAIVGAFRCAHADGTPPLLQAGEMVFSSPWGTLRPSEIMTLRISALDSKGDPIPDGIFEQNKEFSLYRSQAGLPIKVATLSPYMVTESSYQTGGEYYELGLDTNKTQFFEQCEEGVDYFLTENVHNFDRSNPTDWFGVADSKGDYMFLKEKEELDDFFAEENYRFWSGSMMWADTVTEDHPYLIWKKITKIQIPSYDSGPINHRAHTKMENFISDGIKIRIADRYDPSKYGIYEVLEFKKVQAPSFMSWDDVLDPDKPVAYWYPTYHLNVKCIEGRGESLLSPNIQSNSSFGLVNEDGSASSDGIAPASLMGIERNFWIAKETGTGPTDRLTDREAIFSLPTFGSRYAPDQSDMLIGSFNRDYRADDYHLDFQHFNRISHINGRDGEYDVHYAGGTFMFYGQGWARSDTAYYEFNYDWSSKPGAGKDLDNFNHALVENPEYPVDKTRTKVSFRMESEDRIELHYGEVDGEATPFTSLKSAVAIGGSRRKHPLYMYWRHENSDTHYYNQIKRLGDPSDPYDATNKKYVDGKVGRMVSQEAVAEAFTKLQRAVSDETTLEGLKESLVNSLGGLIEEFEHEHD